MKFTDPKSRKQVAAYLARRSLGIDERNEQSGTRWTKFMREQWELEHLGRPTLVDVLRDIAATRVED